jgi:hypothetical protein
MSPTRKELVKWLGRKKIRKGSTVLDIGGNVWSMRNNVGEFETGVYETLADTEGATYNIDLNVPGAIDGKYWDYIFCTEVLQFVHSPLIVLTNLRDSCTLESKVFLSFHLTHPPMKSHDYLRFTEKGIRKLLELSDFKIKEFKEPLPGYFLIECYPS